jgi:hypothetical protein
MTLSEFIAYCKLRGWEYDHYTKAEYTVFTITRWFGENEVWASIEYDPNTMDIMHTELEWYETNEGFTELPLDEIISYVTPEIYIQELVSNDVT